ncbi:MAG: hypothetical protein RLY78_2113, partial [Pseudomonadota bacterium]
EVSGEFDFLLIVHAASMADYHAFTREVFASHLNIRNFKSIFAMNCSKFETRIPLPPAPAAADASARPGAAPSAAARRRRPR